MGDIPNGFMAAMMDLTGYISTRLRADATVPPDNSPLRSVTEDRTYLILTGPNLAWRDWIRVAVPRSLGMESYHEKNIDRKGPVRNSE
jgi:hypothetical protein